MCAPDVRGILLAWNAIYTLELGYCKENGIGLKQTFAII